MVGLQEIRYEAIFQTEWSCFYSITIASYTMSQYEYRRGKAVSVECSLFTPVTLQNKCSFLSIGPLLFYSLDSNKTNTQIP